MLWNKKWLVIWGGIILHFTLITPLIAKDSNNYLSLTIEGVIREDMKIPSLFSTGDNSLAGLLKTIKKAEKDSTIRGIVLYIRSPKMGLAKIQEIQSALKGFRRKGKTIYAYSDTFSKTDYLLSSAANKVYVSPQGGVDLSGLAVELIFFKSTFNLFGVTPNFIQVGDYKSASETYTRSSSSSHQKKGLNILLDGLYNELITNISRNRKIDKKQVEKLINTGFFSAKEAKEAKLIDDYFYEDGFQKLMKQKGEVISYNKKNQMKSGKNINFFQMLTLLSKKPPKKSNDPRIAVIYLEGTIISGRSKKSFFGDSETIGTEDFNVIFRSVRNDSKVKAVVLRINSPGGSALASDILWREIELLSEKKPVIASFSDVAASGGYYLGMACPTIVANATSITGSIGVVGGKFNLKGLYDKLGIQKEVFKRGKHSDIYTDYRDFTDEEKELIIKQMNQTYDTFIRKASKGRKIPIAKMKEIAQGKVYTGRQALKVGLVDRLGGLDSAIQIARDQVKDKNEQLKVVTYPERKSFFELLRSNLYLQNQLLKEIKEVQSIVKPVLNQIYFMQQIFSREKVATITPYFIQFK